MVGICDLADRITGASASGSFWRRRQYTRAGTAEAPDCFCGVTLYRPT
jgi:hypothetical protein